MAASVATYSQNVKTLDEYYDAIDHGHLPVVRGLALTKDDLVRRAVIMALMCQGELLFEPLEQSWLIDFRSYFEAELRQQFQEMAEQGLVSISPEGVKVTTMGWFFVRGVAMVHLVFYRQIGTAHDFPASFEPCYGLWHRRLFHGFDGRDALFHVCTLCGFDGKGAAPAGDTRWCGWRRRLELCSARRVFIWGG